MKLSKPRDTRGLGGVESTVTMTVPRIGSTRYGYDIDVRQAGRTVTRLRVAGRCYRIAGSVFCHRKKLKLSP